MEKYLWDVLNVCGLCGHSAECILDEFTDKLDYNVRSIEEAEASWRTIEEVSFLFDKNLTAEDRYFKLGILLSKLNED